MSNPNPCGLATPSKSSPGASVAVPESMPVKAVPLLEPLAIAVHVADLSHAAIAQRVAVIGLGAIGVKVFVFKGEILKKDKVEYENQ